MVKFLTYYLLFMNVFGFLMMLYDKKMAQKNKWRVEEKTLFTIAAIGGSIGIFAGMYTFKHKTLHASFVIGVLKSVTVPSTLIATDALARFSLIFFAICKPDTGESNCNFAPSGSVISIIFNSFCRIS